MNTTLCYALLLFPLWAAPTSTIAGQANTPPDATAQTTADAAVAPQRPSSLIAPAVDHLREVVSQLHLEHWRSSSRDETDSNLRSIERNVGSTLPQLVTTADAQPASIAASLPLLRNLDALCAVMIRVSVVAHGNAPQPEAESLNGALTALQSARNSLSDQVQSLALAQEKQIADLNNTVATLTARPNTPPPVQPPPLPVAKPHSTHKKTAKPAPAKPTQQ